MKGIITHLLLLVSMAGIAQKGIFLGKIQDAITKQPLEFSTVAVYNLKDSLIGGALAKANGEFQVDRLPAGILKVRIQFVGYVTVSLPLSPSLGYPVKDLGNAKLELNKEMLKTV